MISTILLCLVVFALAALIPWLTFLPQRIRDRRADRAHYENWLKQMEDVKQKLTASINPEEPK